MKKKILFINQKQFGYHIAYVQFCKYLKPDFEISYLCWDYNKNRIFEAGINVIYLSRKGNLVSRNIRFLIEIVKHIRSNNYNQIFVNYFRGCSLIPLLFNRLHRIHLNVVTGFISNKPCIRLVNNFVLKFESEFFRSISVLSKGLREMLKLRENTIILPLGANPMYINRKSEYRICLLYIGTLTNRHIEDTVEGFGLFMQQYSTADIHYIIIGGGLKNETEKINAKITEFELSDYVELKGYIPFSDLVKYYEIANVGVSYVPITPSYEFQPVTKTYEYLMTGIPVIATATYENRMVINTDNGILINDDPKSFAIALGKIYNNIWLYNEQMIRKSVEEFEWKKIVDNMNHSFLG